jgi:glycogen synthase
MPHVERVLMTADAVGGVWTFALDLSRQLAERGIGVTLAVLGPPPTAEQLTHAATIDGLDCVHRPYRLEWMEEPWTDVDAAGEWLLSLEHATRPGVVHLNGFCHASLAWKAPVVVTGHSCVLSWWRAVHGCSPPASWEAYANRVNRGLQAAQFVTAPTAAMLAELDRYYGPLPWTRVVANGRTLDYAPVEKEPFVLTAGRLWDPAKNVSTVCGVASEIPWPIRVAGETRAPGGEVTLCPGVEYLGRLEPNALASWMRRAAIYALPARYEPFGLSALEAALAGCALVLGGIPSLREVWGDAALYVAPDSPHMLTSALWLLIGEPNLRLDLARRARVRAQSLTATAMADAYLDTYSTVAARGRPLSSMAC